MKIQIKLRLYKDRDYLHAFPFLVQQVEQKACLMNYILTVLHAVKTLKEIYKFLATVSFNRTYIITCFQWGAKFDWCNKNVFQKEHGVTGFLSKTLILNVTDIRAQLSFIFPQKL